MLTGFANAPAPRRRCPARNRANRRIAAFAQFLGKLYFFDLGENLRLILLDYAQKRPGTANAAFKAAC
jgi:hypothetical protein